MIKLLGLILVLALSSTATAQTAPNPVVEHFRAYRAALAQGDLAAADAAASAALAASEARDGDGGRTAILALNLASLRLERGDREGALQPAQRAHTLASARDDTNVNSVLSRLVLARALLSRSGASKDELQGAVAAATANQDFAGDVYLAAADLGRQELGDRRYVQAAAAWSVAAAHAHAAATDPVIARANALTLEGVALTYIGAGRNMSRAREPEIAAHARLHEAMQLTRPDFSSNADEVVATSRFRAYATARAWHATLDARLAVVTVPWREETGEDVIIRRGANACVYRAEAEPMPEYPRSAQSLYEVGAVVVIMHVNAEDVVVRRELIVSAPPNEEFDDAVRAAFDQWPVRRAEESPPDCKPGGVAFIPITFQMPW